MGSFFFHRRKGLTSPQPVAPSSGGVKDHSHLAARATDAFAVRQRVGFRYPAGGRLPGAPCVFGRVGLCAGG